jgi:hypothetical protein
VSFSLSFIQHRMQAKADWHRGSGAADIPGVRTVCFHLRLIQTIKDLTCLLMLLSANSANPEQEVEVIVTSLNS